MSESQKNFLAVANCQLTSVDLVEKCLAQVQSRLDELDNFKELDLVCFPENSLYMRMKEGEEVPGIELDHPSFSQIANWAKSRNCYVHLGSVAIRESQGVTNSSVLVAPTGKHWISYRKMHLFDVDLDHEKSIRESDAFQAGTELSCLDIHGWKIAQTICYDLRFSELYALYKAKEPVDLFLVPSAFTVPTGSAHWEILLRARAIETQCYLIAAAQGGHHRGERGEKKTYGHGLSIDPWGQVLSSTTNSAPIAYNRLSKDLLAQVRKQIPMISHRKLVPFLTGVKA